MKGSPEKNLRVEEVCRKLRARGTLTSGSGTFNPPTPENLDPETGAGIPYGAYSYATQMVEVEVDTETGQFEVLRVFAAHDVGRAINPDLVVGQIEGAVVQAHGYAITEAWSTKAGRVLSDQLSTYLLPTILDIPAHVESVLVEIPDPNGPWGARGLGELPFLPYAPAVAAAIHDAAGVWINEFPFTPERVLRALGKI